MERSEVYKLIDSERDYQSKWNNIESKNNVSDFIIYMQNYLDAAMADNNPCNPTYSLDSIRKVTALGVACMEMFDTQPRRVN
jgi:hypothetical protein